MTFAYDVVYQEGRQISHADAMSCLKFQTKEANEVEATNAYTQVNVATINEFKAECLHVSADSDSDKSYH